MKRFLITALLAIGLAGSVFAQDMLFNVVKTDGTTDSYPMNENTRIYCSETELYVNSLDFGSYTYAFSTIRKAYFSATQSIDEIDNQQLAIFPNPAKDVLRIANIADNQEVTIYSINGAVIKRVIVSEDDEVNISELRPGMYIVSAGNMFSKFIKM